MKQRKVSRRRKKKPKRNETWKNLGSLPQPSPLSLFNALLFCSSYSFLSCSLCMCSLFKIWKSSEMQFDLDIWFLGHWLSRQNICAKMQFTINDTQRNTPHTRVCTRHVFRIRRNGIVSRKKMTRIATRRKWKIQKSKNQICKCRLHTLHTRMHVKNTWKCGHKMKINRTQARTPFAIGSVVLSHSILCLNCFL